MPPTTQGYSPNVFQAIRALAPSANRLSYFLSAIPSLLNSPRPICFFTGVMLKDHEVDVVYLDTSGDPREKLDKRTGLLGGVGNKSGGTPANPEAQSAAPIHVWCHASLADFMGLVMEGRFYRHTSKFPRTPYLVYEQMANRLKRVLKRVPRVREPLAVAAPKKEAPCAVASPPSPHTSPPLGTPPQEASEVLNLQGGLNQSPYPSLPPITDAEFVRWVQSLPFNHWNERDLIIHFLGKPMGYIPKQSFMAKMESFLIEAKTSAPILFATVTQRYKNINWGTVGVNTDWVDYKEV